MDIYQFIASLAQSITSLAWPVAFFGSIWLFRGKITELLPLLRLKYKDVEASFRLDQAEKEAAELPTIPGEPPARPTPEETSKFESLAELSPRAAIVEARMDVEEAVRSLAKAANLLTPKAQSILGLTRMLRSHNVIDAQTSALLDDLRVIGNSAAHDLRSGFTKEDAMRYRALVNELSFVLGFQEEGYRVGR